MTTRAPPRRSALGALRGFFTRRAENPPPAVAAAPPPRKPGVLYVGYAEAALGIGESFRNLLTALDAAGHPFAIHPFNKAVEERYIGPFMSERYDTASAYDTNVIEVTVDQLAIALDELGPRCLAPARNILRPWWELPRAPAAWEPLLRPIDEIWAPTEFVATAFRDVFAGRIRLVPPSVSVARSTCYDRAHFGLERGRFYFLLTFDYSSVSERKNPLGLIEAFGKAFPDRSRDVGLVIKSHGWATRARETRRAIARAAKRDGRVVVLDKSMGRDEILSLIEGADCYASLHRSEGFGFGPAEAMAFGKPVVATDFSGTRDFVGPETGYPVPFALRALGAGEYPDGEGQMWAEPDNDAAARIFQSVYEDGRERSKRAAAGKSLIESRFGPVALADRVRELLEGGDAAL